MAETTDAAADTAGVRSSLLTSLPLTNTAIVSLMELHVECQRGQ